MFIVPVFLTAVSDLLFTIQHCGSLKLVPKGKFLGTRLAVLPEILYVHCLVDVSFYWPSKAKLAWTECTSFPYFILETDIHVAS